MIAYKISLRKKKLLKYYFKYFILVDVIKEIILARKKEFKKQFIQILKSLLNIF